MIGYRIRRFLEAWHAEDTASQVFLAWDAANTVLAFGLLFSSFFLLVVTSAAGFQRTLLLGYVAVALAWLVSIFTIGPMYDRFDPPEATE